MTVTEDAICTHARGGVLRSRYEDEKHIQGCGAAVRVDAKTLAIGSDAKGITLYDTMSGRVSSFIEGQHAGGCALASTPRTVCCGTRDGKLELYDVRVKRAVGKVTGLFSGRVLDMSYKSDLVVACGETPPLKHGFHAGKPQYDNFVKVFDVRAMRLLAPKMIKGGATCVDFIPRFTSQFLCVGADGSITFMDAGVGVGSSVPVAMVRGAGVTTCTALSSSSDIMAFGDQGGVVCMLTNKQSPIVNVGSNPTEPLPEYHGYTPLGLDTNTLVLEMPASNAPNTSNIAQSRISRLSEWGGGYMRGLYPTSPVDASLIADKNASEGVAFAPYPKNYIRNCPESMIKFTAASSNSDKFRKSAVSKRSFLGPTRGATAIPREYARVKIQIPRFGLHTFDFSSYNTTRFAGLLNLLPNSYTVVIIQMLYHNQVVRANVLNHICDRELCLTCELNFLFHMMSCSRGGTSEPRNFLRILGQVRDAMALGLLEGLESSRDSLLSVRIQDFGRFLLRHLRKETLEEGKASFIDRLFGFEWEEKHDCQEGKHVSVSRQDGMSVRLEYPTVRRRQSFVQLLEAGLNLDQTNRVWCEKCGKYRSIRERRAMCTFPFDLVVNANIDRESHLDMWREADGQGVDSGWIPHRIFMSHDSKAGKTKVERGSGSSATTAGAKERGGDDQRYEYELVGLVAHITDPEDTDSKLNVYNAEHLTAHVSVPEMLRPEDRWHLFNDFVITPSTPAEAIRFHGYPWKQPCLLVYQRVDIFQKIDVPQRKRPILEAGRKAFLHPESLSTGTTLRTRELAPLLTTEKVDKKMMVAIDCEFVCVEKQVTRPAKNPGKPPVVLKPMRHSLARVSLVRATGQRAGAPLLDDYIVSSEPIVDYLTRYSGIEPGDLDRKVSTRHLVTLKSTYLRLRYLADCGVTFIGHGLASDFMHMNIFIPKSQIIDTVELFHLPGTRKLSLRFLAAHVLKTDIQGKTHDSIEDARTALQLYNRYMELKKEGRFQEFLKDLYEIGNSVGFKTFATPAAPRQQA